MSPGRGPHTVMWIPSRSIYHLRFICMTHLCVSWFIHLPEYVRKQSINPVSSIGIQITVQLHNRTCLWTERERQRKREWESEWVSGWVREMSSLLEQIQKGISPLKSLCCPSVRLWPFLARTLSITWLPVDWTVDGVLERSQYKYLKTVHPYFRGDLELPVYFDLVAKIFATKMVYNRFIV